MKFSRKFTLEIPMSEFYEMATIGFSENLDA